MADLQSLDSSAARPRPDAALRPQSRGRGGEADRCHRCIGCKACQAACMEWNDLRDEIGYFEGTYDNPHRSRPKHLDADALHRVGGRERQSRMADPQGRLHALRGSGLPEGLPGARRDRAVRQRHRRLHQRELHRLRLLRQGLPVQHPADQSRSIASRTSARCARTASRSARSRPAPRRARPGRSCSAPRPT